LKSGDQGGEGWIEGKGRRKCSCKGSTAVAEKKIIMLRRDKKQKLEKKRFHSPWLLYLLERNYPLHGKKFRDFRKGKGLQEN